jgi:hypothetical protein
MRTGFKCMASTPVTVLSGRTSQGHRDVRGIQKARHGCMSGTAQGAACMANALSATWAAILARC